MKNKLIQTTVIKQNKFLKIGKIYYTNNLDDKFAKEFCKATTIQANINFNKLMKQMEVK